MMFDFSKCFREAKILHIIGMHIDMAFLESYLTKYTKIFNYVQTICIINMFIEI